MKTTGLIISVVIILSIAQVYTQKRLEAYQRVEKESLLYLPSGKYLQPLTLGYNQMVADLLWIKTVAYFGSHFMTDKEYPWLSHMLNLIIDLDPLFDFPYYFGGIVLSLEASQIESANKILERGIKAYPEKWEYPFYIGFNHFYHGGDPKRAIPYINRAAALSGAPNFLKRLEGKLLMDLGEHDAALSFFREVLQNSTDELLRRKIRVRIDQILSERKTHAESD